MDRFDVINFADLSGPGGGEWVRIGGGSFGVVFKGEYLGTDVAIKEVLPNNTYDVEKYFERECVLMKEARHPNIVQYIGLTKSPGPDGRIYIISEFVGGNLRSYLADKRKPFDWPLRISFATDIARAVAYLHARNCLHRDLKGENLLITANDRIKVCDFGFARIAARNEEEMRRISYCGTDGYMSPEILMGVDFSLPSDVFSLGVIFCEIASRHLVDQTTFKRQMPSFGLDADEVREMASEGCPEGLITLCLACVDEDPAKRPEMREVLRRLREVEQEVLTREAAKGALTSVGSLRGSSLKAVLGSRRASRPRAPRLPSFDGQVDVGRRSTVLAGTIREETHSRSGSEDSTTDDDMEEALAALEKVGIDADALTEAASSPQKPKASAHGTAKGVMPVGVNPGSTFKIAGHGNPWWIEDDDASLPSLRMSWIGADKARKGHAEEASDAALLPKRSSILGAAPGGTGESDYSTSVIRPSKVKDGHGQIPSALSGATNGAPFSSLSRASARSAFLGSTAGSTMSVATIRAAPEAAATEAAPEAEAAPNVAPEEVTPSFMTARSSQAEHHGHVHSASDASFANATIASSIYSPAPLFHRFTLVKNGMKRPNSLGAAAAVAALGANAQSSGTGSLLPPGVIFANALSKCSVCSKRLGFGAFMDCDDCPYKTHVACAQSAEPNCHELQIPSTPVLSAVNVSRRRGGSPEVNTTGTPNSVRTPGSPISRATSPGLSAAQALVRAVGGDVTNLANSADSLPNRAAAQTPPPAAPASSGRSIWRLGKDKRASKSPPPREVGVAK